MNPAEPKHPWQRLVAAVRRTRDDRDVTAPYGFATRIAALALTAERPVISVLERLSLRALGIATLLAVLSVTAHFTLPSSPTAEEDELSVDDPVAVLLDVS